MSDLPMFFVVGIPRSGTTWLAAFLASMNRDWLMVHEAHKMDYDVSRIAAFQPWQAEGYVFGARRLRVLDYIERKKPNAIGYGEVTPRVYYFTDSIRKCYPDAKYVHLVRDPRKAVVSLMNYGYFAGDRGRLHRRMSPDSGKWQKHVRAAWGWAYGHYCVRRSIEKFVRLEDILSNFDEMKKLTDFLEIECDRAHWEKRRVKKVNVSNPTHPEYQKWSPQWRRDFRAMCGAEARQYGYLAD